MAKKLMSVMVQGKRSKYHFDFYGDTKHLKGWRDDGLEIDLIENVIPAWVVEIGMLKPWIFLQDVFNFKNPFSK